MGEDRDTEFADALAEVGRRVGQAMTDALERIRPTFDALAEVANRPEVRAVIERAEKAMRRRPCLCFCSRAHPADRGICEMFDAVITGQYSSDLLGDVDVPLCAPCAAAPAAHPFPRCSTRTRRNGAAPRTGSAHPRQAYGRRSPSTRLTVIR
jgi:hypothetical protein